MTPSKPPSQTLPRFSAIAMYPEDQRNKRVIEKYWKGLMGARYAFAEVQRILFKQEADRISQSEKSDKTTP